jgi:hypothetical protein
MKLSDGEQALIGLTAWAAAILVGCTITVKPLPPQKKHHHYTHRSNRIKKAGKQEKPTPAKNIKETWWVENYHKLEAARGDYTIPEDADIEPLPDGRFRVPNAVLTHYQDLLLVTPTPKP